MNFQELGLTLQREREKKGLSIDVVMEATKISRINIEALEKGDRSGLPHPVYTKGFVKSYARFIGLDADELSMVVDREYQAEEDDADEVSYDVAPAAEKALHDPETSAIEKKRSVWPAILISLLLIGGAVALLIVLSDNGGKQVAEMQQSTEIVEEAAPVETPSVETPLGDTEDAKPEVADEQPAGAESQPSEAEAVQPEATETKPDVKPEPQPEAKPAVKPVEKLVEKKVEKVKKPKKQPYDHVLIIRATTAKGCWIGVWRGNETDMARDFVLKQGEPLRLMFNNPRRVRIGNAAGVSVMYNGKPYPLNTAKGNIQTLKFGMN